MILWASARWWALRSLNHLSRFWATTRLWISSLNQSKAAELVAIRPFDLSISRARRSGCRDVFNAATHHLLRNPFVCFPHGAAAGPVERQNVTHERFHTRIARSRARLERGVHLGDAVLSLLPEFFSADWVVLVEGHIEARARAVRDEDLSSAVVQGEHASSRELPEHDLANKVLSFGLPDEGHVGIVPPGCLSAPCRAVREPVSYTHLTLPTKRIV